MPSERIGSWPLVRPINALALPTSKKNAEPANQRHTDVIGFASCNQRRGRQIKRLACRPRYLHLRRAAGTARSLRISPGFGAAGSSCACVRRWDRRAC